MRLSEKVMALVLAGTLTMCMFSACGGGGGGGSHSPSGDPGSNSPSSSNSPSPSDPSPSDPGSVLTYENSKTKKYFDKLAVGMDYKLYYEYTDTASGEFAKNYYKGQTKGSNYYIELTSADEDDGTIYSYYIDGDFYMAMDLPADDETHHWFGIDYFTGIPNSAVKMDAAELEVLSKLDQGSGIMVVSPGMVTPTAGAIEKTEQTINGKTYYGEKLTLNGSATTYYFDDSDELKYMISEEDGKTMKVEVIYCNPYNGMITFPTSKYHLFSYTEYIVARLDKVSELWGGDLSTAFDDSENLENWISLLEALPHPNAQSEAYLKQLKSLR